MDLLTITHPDFTMQVECSFFPEVLGKAKRNIGEPALLSAFHWSDKRMKVVRSHADGSEQEIKPGEAQYLAFFFDNTNYSLWVDFNDRKPNKASLSTSLKSAEESFHYRKNRGTLSGTINYGNDIGKSELAISYDTERRTELVTFSFEVLSTKLDYHQHWKTIIDDIEAEYRMLSIDFLKRTYHSFTREPGGDTPAVIWWNLFKQEQERFIQACQFILNRPRHRVHSHFEFVRADKLKRITPCIENELFEHKANIAHLYRSEVNQTSHDTQENRFLKFALNTIARKYEILSSHIKGLPGISESCCAEMEGMRKKLRGLCANPFFRTVGPFTTLTQESLVLQRATGYSTVYRTWLILKAAYSLRDGLYRLETKDIATLYEIWCFIEVKNIIQSVLPSPCEIDNQNRTEMGQLFVHSLSTGEQSKIIFNNSGKEPIELCYNSKLSDEETLGSGIEKVISPTVAQRPDIILQLTKYFGSDSNFKLTYLFDAKYRIAGRLSNGVDTPPDDAINQMHRYRDALYYQGDEYSGIKKEVIGGYILFPGDGDPLAVQLSNFYNTIEQVNIGAFPLRPDKKNHEVLRTFISKLIQQDGHKQIQNTIPQKGTTLRMEYEKDLDFILHGTCHGQEQLSWMKDNKVYPMRLKKCEEMGMTQEKASTYKQLVVVWEAGIGKDIKYEVLNIGSFLGSVTRSDLMQQYGYKPKSDSENYYLWALA
jgi:hypothetical protein